MLSGVLEEHAPSPLQSVAKDVITEKFNGKNTNTETWIAVLETECARLNIPQSRKCEVIRLFLEGTAMDWYTTNRTLLGTSTWSMWKQSFLDNFASRCWNDVYYAFNYRFVGGSITDYALKNQR